MIPDAKTIASKLNSSDQMALASLPQPDWGYLPDELWWLFYGLLDLGLMAGGEDRMMRRTDLGEAVLSHLRNAEAG